LRNKAILFLCCYLAVTVLVLGLLLPSYISARQATNNDNAGYERDKMLQIKHDTWLNSDEAKHQDEEHQREYDSEMKQEQSYYNNTQSITGIPNMYNDLIPLHVDLNFINSLVGAQEDYPTYHDALAWNKAGGYPSFNWQWSDQLRLSIDRGNLIHYESMLYIFLLASVAYWIIVIGMLFYLKPKDIQVR
jgi:hypothetical protein